MVVTGLPVGGNGLNPAQFSEGTADLAYLGMILTVAAPPSTVQLTASSANGKQGISGDVTITDAPIPPAADYYVNDGTAEGGIAAGDNASRGTSPDAPMASIQALLNRYPSIITQETRHH